MIDLSTLQAGNRVKLRGGMELEIRHNQVSDIGQDRLLEFKGFPEGGWIYDNDGQWDGEDHTPFDIIEIIPKPFD